MTISGDESQRRSDITVEITQTCGLSGPTEDKQGDNSGQRRNAAGVDWQHSARLSSPSAAHCTPVQPPRSVKPGPFLGPLDCYLSSAANT